MNTFAHIVFWPDVMTGHGRVGTCRIVSVRGTLNGGARRTSRATTIYSIEENSHAQSSCVWGKPVHAYCLQSWCKVSRSAK